MLQSATVSFDEVLLLAKHISEMYMNFRLNSPYHINLLDLLSANENTHSKILGALLETQSNGKYEVLQDFIDTFFNDFAEKISRPKFFNERHRIDLLIVEDGKYALIFENKIHNAILQKNQLARYIDAMKKEGFAESQIFVIFLPPDEHNKPNDCCWKTPQKCCEQCDKVNIPDECLSLYSYKVNFEGRFAYLTFMEDILPWLKENVLPNCKVKDVYMQSALMQYIDHLEGMFGLRKNEIKLNMEIKDYIRKTLELSDNPELSYTPLKEKIEDVNNVLNQLTALKNEIETECWKKWLKQLRDRYPNLKLIDYSNDKKLPKVGVILSVKDKSFAVLIERETNIYYGIGRHECSQELDLEVKNLVKPVLEEIGGFQETQWWYGWRYTSFENGYKRLCCLIDNVMESII